MTDIFFGSDYIATEKHKTALKKAMEPFGNVIDVVEKDPSLDNYIKVAQALSRQVQQKKSFGVLMCSSSLGMCIVANKHKRILAASCMKPWQAEKTKIANNANVLCLAAKTPLKQNVKIIQTFFSTLYAGRKPERIEAIKAIEDHNMK